MGPTPSFENSRPEPLQKPDRTPPKEVKHNNPYSSGGGFLSDLIRGPKLPEKPPEAKKKEEAKKPVEEKKNIFGKRAGGWLTRDELVREAEKLTQFETKMDRKERKEAVIELPKKYGQLIDEKHDIKDWKKELKKEQSHAHTKEGLDLKHKREMFEKLEKKKIT